MLLHTNSARHAAACSDGFFREYASKRAVLCAAIENAQLKIDEIKHFRDDNQF